MTALFEAIDATWPAAAFIERGPWTLREGQGGGKRVSAATARQAVSEHDVDAAEKAMHLLDQQPLFMLRSSDKVLDGMLAARGYRIIDPVEILCCDIDRLTDRPIPPVTAFTIWEPLAIMEEIWAQAGIGAARLAVMHRAKVKTAVFARWNQKPAGTAFIAVHEGIAMVHAVEVLSEHRRQGVAGWIMRQAAFWARNRGAQCMAVLCTKDNAGALQLYNGLGFERAGEYHYRYNPKDGDPRNG
jgi:GNAT superfamily N-acetyltransferase